MVESRRIAYVAVSETTTFGGGTHHITGGMSVPRGATLDLENSTVHGSISASHPDSIRICGTTLNGLVVTAATGYVRVGDPTSNCTPNTLRGGLLATNNTGAGTVIGNTISDGWIAIANTPAFTVSGNHR